MDREKQEKLEKVLKFLMKRAFDQSYDSRDAVLDAGFEEHDEEAITYIEDLLSKYPHSL